MSLKYLLSSLRSHPDLIPISETDFSCLLQDVQVGREKLTVQKLQEDFNAACGRMVEDITKGYPLETEPFLKPVSKKHAPGYDEVITEPMDFTTVGKKIKAKEYKNKTAFEKDLKLIWENCLRYNMPPHPIRDKAFFLERAVTHYLTFLPDRNEDKSFQVPDATKRLQIIANGGVGVAAPVMVKDEVGVEGAGAAQTAVTTTGFKSQPFGKQSILKFDGHTLLDNRKRLQEIQLTPSGSDASEKKAKPEPSWFPMETVDESEVAEELEWWKAMVLPDAVGAQMPCVAGPSKSRAEGFEEESAAQKRRYGSDSFGRRFNQNINLLADVRDTAATLSNLASGNLEEAAAAPPEKVVGHSKNLRIFKRNRKRSSDGDGEVDMSEQLAAGNLRMMTGIVFNHVGFEACNTSGIDMVSQMASEYIMGMGKTFALLKEQARGVPNVSAADIVLRALANNGGSTVDDLDSYVQEDVVRYGTKLEDMLKRLQQALDEQYEPVEENEEDIAEDDMMFGGLPAMGGMDDFLGIGGFGAVPKKLLRGERKLKAPVEKKEASAPPLDFIPPPPPPPLTQAAIGSQIGVLRAFYAAKVDSENGLKDVEFDSAVISQIGAFGQVVTKGQPGGVGKKKEDAKGKKGKSARGKNTTADAAPGEDMASPHDDA